MTNITNTSLNVVGTALLGGVLSFLHTGDYKSALICGVFGIAALAIYEFKN